MKLYFYIIKQKKIKSIKWNEYNILNDMLNYKIRIPNINDNNSISVNIINKIKSNISQLNTYFPLYNIKIRNIVIVKQSNITNLVKNHNYRFCDKYILNLIKKEIKKYNNKKINNNQNIS